MTQTKAIDKRLQRAMDIMESLSYMILDENEEGLLLFSTRENGNVFKERYEHAYRMAKILKEKGFQTSIQCVDEWVLLLIKTKTNEEN